MQLALSLPLKKCQPHFARNPPKNPLNCLLQIVAPCQLLPLHDDEPAQLLQFLLRIDRLLLRNGLQHETIDIFLDVLRSVVQDMEVKLEICYFMAPVDELLDFMLGLGKGKVALSFLFTK